MSKSKEQINCYLPCTQEQLARMPKTIEQYLDWQAKETELNPFLGRFHWVLQTQIHLSAAGMPARLTNQLDEPGVLYTHVDCLPYGTRPTTEQIIVAALVDKELPLPNAWLHITHNPAQRLPWFGRHQYMTPWPQIGLVSRNPARGDRFENVYFMGNSEHLHPHFRTEAFQNELGQLNLKLVVPSAKDWHDFSEADCVMAIRNFGTENKHIERPALKLINSWLAGTPAILGHETAYREVGREGIDYLEASSEQMVLDALKRLSRDASFRRGVAAKGIERRAQFSDDSLKAHWAEIFEKLIFPQLHRLNASRLLQYRELTLRKFRERAYWRYPKAFARR
jgi:hypothetical protein